jgi:hypothetical protein
MGDRKLRIFATFVLSLFLVMQAGVTFCAHTHWVEGHIIVHSHPFSDKAHAHTTVELVSFAQITHLLSDTPEGCLNLGDPDRDYSITIECAHEGNAHVRIDCTIGLRAPPALVA